MNGATDWVALFGRFHPLLVHMPIGMIGAVVVVGLISLWRDAARPAYQILLALTALSAIAAATAGWMLASEGGYETGTLFWHRWTGIGLAALLTIAAVFAQLPRCECRRVGVLRVLPLAGALGLVAVAGHLGGSLTHGPDYLTRYAPAWLGGGSTPETSLPDDTSITGDAAVVLAMVRASCVECHGPTKRKGDLRLDEPEGIASVVVAGDPSRSELFRRVSLPRGHGDLMPPDGEPLDDETVLAVMRWIRDGAAMGAIGSELQEEADAATEDAARIQSLRDTTGAIVTSIPVDGARLLEVDYSLGVGEVTFAELGPLASMAERVFEVNLAGRIVSDEVVGKLTPMPALERLHLERSNVDDACLARWIEAAPNVRYLNIHSTGVTDASLGTIEALPRLDRLVLFGTALSERGVTSLRAARPEVDITGELGLPAQPSPDGQASQDGG